MKYKALLIMICIIAPLWAQQPPQPIIPDPGTSFLLFDQFNSVPTISTEGRYSAGVFSSDVDNYIDVNAYNHHIGTFFFLGGRPSNLAKVDQSDPNTMGQNRVNFGMGRTLGAFYIAVYYGGSLVNSEYIIGRYSSFDPDDYPEYDGPPYLIWNDDVEVDRSLIQSVWRNDLALLLGTPNVGAFRLDLTVDMDTESSRHPGASGTITLKRRSLGPTVALTWGGINFGGIEPYVTFGFRFPREERLTFTIAETNQTGWDSFTVGGRLGVQIGALYNVSPSSQFFGDIAYVYYMPNNQKYSSKEAALELTFGTADSGWKTGGGFGTGLRGGYKGQQSFGDFTLGFEPLLSFSFERISHKTTKTFLDGTKLPEDPSENFMALKLALSLGAQYSLTEKINFYTGARLNVMEWIQTSYTGGDMTNDDRASRITGINWEPSIWATNLADHGPGTRDNILGFGMTVSPVEGLVAGIGLNTLLNKFFVINLAEMRVDSGTLWNDTATQSTGAWAGRIFADIRLDLTLSYSY
ncbi:MAG: hypothetical protein FWH12_09600 [Treponema sp.]|nr:hypothetical protein [Treponema sp.]